MAENVNEHKVIFSADIADIKGKLQELQKAMQDAGLVSASVGNQMASTMGASMAKVGSSLKSLGTTLSVGITAPLSLLGVALFNSAAQMEQITVSFEVFTGSAEVAKNMLGQLKDQALNSPMQFQDITKGAQTLLGYGLTASQVIPITKMLGDISGGNADKFGRLSLAFGQVNAAGRLMGQETRQMINAGFNPLQAISEKTGESMASLTKRMHDGKISVQEVANAFIYATTEGGRFFGNADRQSQTLQGQFNKLQESVTFALAEIGTSLANNGGLKDFFTSLTSMVTRVKDAFLSLSPETQSFILKLGLFLAVAGPVLVVFGSMVGAITSIATVVGALTAAFVGLNVVSGGILIGLGIIVHSLINVGIALEKDINSVKEFRKEVEDTQKSLNAFKFVSLTEDIRGLYAQIEKLQTLRTKQFFDPVALDKTDKQIKSLRNQIINLQKINEKNNPLEPFNNTPSGAEDSQNKAEKTKIQKLIQSNKDAVAEIAMIWMSNTDKKLAELKLKYDQEIRDYVKYKLDYSNITKKYEAEKSKILEDATRQREADNIKAHATELAGLTAFYKEIEDKEAQRQADAIKSHQEQTVGLKMEYPKFAGDFAKDALDNDLANKLKTYGDSVYAATKDVSLNLMAGFSEIAGAALVSGLSLEDTFKSLGAMILGALGDYLIKIGTAAIAAGTVGTILKAFFTGGAATVPELGIAGGMAAVAVGSAMKALSGKVSDTMSKTKNPNTSGAISSVSSKASGSSYQYGGSSYASQSIRMMVDLTGSITATPTGYSINKSFETTLRVTGR